VTRRIRIYSHRLYTGQVAAYDDFPSPAYNWFDGSWKPMQGPRFFPYVHGEIWAPTKLGVIERLFSSVFMGAPDDVETVIVGVRSFQKIGGGTGGTAFWAHYLDCSIVGITGPLYLAPGLELDHGIIGLPPLPTWLRLQSGSLVEDAPHLYVEDVMES